MKNYWLLILVGLGITLSSCGQKGDLVRPPPSNEQPLPAQEITHQESTQN